MERLSATAWCVDAAADVLTQALGQARPAEEGGEGKGSDRRTVNLLTVSTERLARECLSGSSVSRHHSGSPTVDLFNVLLSVLGLGTQRPLLHSSASP